MRLNKMMRLNLLTPVLLSKMQKDIYEFRTTFGLGISDKLNDSDDTLHTSLIVEELGELSDADTEVNRIDAIVDSVYVLMGRFVQNMGLYPVTDMRNHTELYMVEVLLQVAAAKKFNFEACWNEVHASNMSKVCNTRLEAIDNARHYGELGIDIDTPKIGNYFVLKCLIDQNGEIKPGKVIKSIYYRPAKLEGIMYL
jgi:hypothetical protein